MLVDLIDPSANIQALIDRQLQDNPRKTMKSLIKKISLWQDSLQLVVAIDILSQYF